MEGFLAEKWKLKKVINISKTQMCCFLRDTRDLDTLTWYLKSQMTNFRLNLYTFKKWYSSKAVTNRINRVKDSSNYELENRPQCSVSHLNSNIWNRCAFWPVHFSRFHREKLILFRLQHHHLGEHCVNSSVSAKIHVHCTQPHRSNVLTLTRANCSPMKCYHWELGEDKGKEQGTERMCVLCN